MSTPWTPNQDREPPACRCGVGSLFGSSRRRRAAPRRRPPTPRKRHQIGNPTLWSSPRLHAGARDDSPSAPRGNDVDIRRPRNLPFGRFLPATTTSLPHGTLAPSHIGDSSSTMIIWLRGASRKFG